jgi:phosphate transport system substrate-binding protein
MPVQKQKITAVLFSLVSISAVLGVTSCSSNTIALDKSNSFDIKIDGSKTLAPITTAVVEEFTKSKDGKIKISVDAEGTGKGLQKFCRGEADIANTSRPIQEKEIIACKGKGIDFLELPIAYDALTLVINPANTWATKLKLEDLKKMWGAEAQGKILKWKEVRSDFPDFPLRLFGAASNSGTFDYFTETINGKGKVGRIDYLASEDNDLIRKGVEADENAIGYVGYSYYEANKDKIKAVEIDAGKGPVLPSINTIKNTTYQPFSRPLFIYISSKSIEKPNVKKFVEYYLANASKISTSKNYVPLPTAVYSRISERAKSKKFGSVFGSKEAVGLKMEDILSKM